MARAKKPASAETDPARLRERLLLATLDHVTFDGWTTKALRSAAEDLELPFAEALNAFPGGPAEMVEAFNAWADTEMLRRLEQQDLESLKLRDRISAGVRTRLEVLAPHKEPLRRALAFLALPNNAALGLRCLYRSVDAIWHAAGDRSTDYNFYSKRLLLAGVMSSTLLYWLNDDSEDQAESWAFLERRITGVLKVGGRVGKTMTSLLDLPDRVMRRRGRRTGRGPVSPSGPAA